MGAVFKAKQISLNRLVAIKMIRADYLATEDHKPGLQHEAEALATLDHPHIVPILKSERQQTPTGLADSSKVASGGCSTAEIKGYRAWSSSAGEWSPP